MNKKLSEVVSNMVKQKDEFIMEKLKELFDSGAIWLESSGMKVVDEFGKFNIKEDVRFNFSGLDKINELKDTIERLKCCSNCIYETFDGDCFYCGYFEDTRKTDVCKRRMDSQSDENPDLWKETTWTKGKL